MIINGIEFFNAPTPKLLNRDIDILINDKIKLFNKKLSKLKFTKDNNYNSFDDFVGVLSGYELYFLNQVSIKKGCGGWCDATTKSIALDFSDQSKISILCHEIGHSIQAESGLWVNKKMLLSDMLKFEHQCETIGMYLYNKLPFIKTETRKWDTYFKKEDIDFLINWHNGYYENDLKKV